MQKTTKIIIALTLCLLSGRVFAQDSYPVFSPAVLGGIYDTTGKKIKKANAPSQKVIVTPKKTITLKYADNGFELTDEHKRLLYTIVQYNKTTPVNRIETQTFTQNRHLGHSRNRILEQYFNAYIPNTHIDQFVTDGNLVMPQDMNTAKIRVW